MRKKYVALFALLITNILFGLNFSFSKELMAHYISPFGFVLCRTSIPAALFFLIGSLLKIREKIDRKDWWRLILCSIFSIGLNQFCFLGGLNITTPINASIIMTSNPVLVLIIAAILIKERMTTNKIIGIAVGLSGALLLLMFKKGFEFGTKTLLGDTLIFLNATFYAVYLVIVKPLMKKYKPITVIKWIFLFGFILSFPFGIHQLSMVKWHTFSPEAWVGFAEVILLGTFVTYLLTIFALKSVSASTAAIFIYIQPLIAAVVAISFGQDTITFVKIMATVLIFSGVYLVSKQPKVFKTQ